MKNDLTAERLREVLDYDPETGIFRWKAPRSPRLKKGDIAGTKGQNGRIQICIGRKQYLAHRLAWLYVYGTGPKIVIDHINGDPSDNRISNLRDVRHSVNSENMRSSKLGSKSGLIGATFSAGRNKWISRITVRGKTMFIGSFKTAEEAHKAYVEAKRLLHEGCTI